jgi:hypothetical protein
MNLVCALADKPGPFWKSLPKNIQAIKNESAPCRKERFCIPVCADADLSHCLKCVAVGKSEQPSACGTDGYVSCTYLQFCKHLVYSTILPAGFTVTLILGLGKVRS